MKKIFIIIVIFAVLGFLVPFIRSIPLPPGCRNTGLIKGGCFGKQSIEISEKQIPDDCLEVYIDNCNTPNIRIDINNCKETLIVEGISYENGEQFSVGLETGPFSIEGYLSSQPLSIRGNVTKPLCD